jgi:hypothetical protein
LIKYKRTRFTNQALGLGRLERSLLQLAAATRAELILNMAVRMMLVICCHRFFLPDIYLKEKKFLGTVNDASRCNL